MAKLEQRTGSGRERKKLGLAPGGFLAPKHGPPVRVKLKNKLNRAGDAISRKVDVIASNAATRKRNRQEEKSSRITEEPTLTINTSDNSNTTIGRDTSPSASDRFSEIVLGQPMANPNINAANLAGGSRPMTAMDNPQIDPVTGMPITPGGQPNMNPNFIGGMANSNMPTTGMLAQEKYDAAKADLNNNGVTEDWEKAKAEKFTVAQEKKMMRTMKPLVKYKPSETYSNYKDFRGDMQKATIDDSTFTSDSTLFKSGINPKYKLDMNMSYNYNKENNPKAVEFSERMTPEINQSRRSTKCMRVKKK
tara:strand:- start:125 stop:1042 length:918 start_codon:yes stop_codon:yes gene_type:complete